MNGRDPDRFEIRFDDTPLEPVDPEEVENRRLERLRFRITLVATLVPLLLGCALAVGYFDLNRRMAAVGNTGSTEVKKVTETLESSFSSISVQVAKLEESVNDRLEKVQTEMADAGKRMDRLEKGLEQLNRGKLDEKALAQAVQKREAAVSDLKQQLETAIGKLASGQEAVQENLAANRQQENETASRIDGLRTELRGVGEQVESLVRLQTELKLLDLARKTDRETLEKQMNRLAEDLQGRIEALSDRVTDLSRKLAAQRTKPLTGPSPPAPPSQPSSPSDSGSIVEQDLK